MRELGEVDGLQINHVLGIPQEDHFTGTLSHFSSLSDVVGFNASLTHGCLFKAAEKMPPMAYMSREAPFLYARQRSFPV